MNKAIMMVLVISAVTVHAQFVDNSVAVAKPAAVKSTTSAVVSAPAVVTPEVDRFKVGAHGGLTMGGDVEQGSAAVGGQIICGLNENFSLELSGTKFSDQLDVLDLDVMSMAFTVRAETKYVYGGAGFSFNQFDVGLDLPGIQVTMEDAFGFHVALGLRTRFSKSFELFGEYRMTWLDTTALVKGPCDEEIVDGSYDFGLIRIGLNLVL
jgi:opacity protein-like surface antigen